MDCKWTTATLDELMWPHDGTWPDLISVGMGDGRGPDAEYRPYADVRTSEERSIRQHEEINRLRNLCEWLLEPYRLGAVTGEGVDREWCRETYDKATQRLRKLGSGAGE